MNAYYNVQSSIGATAVFRGGNVMVAEFNLFRRILSNCRKSAAKTIRTRPKKTDLKHQTDNNPKQPAQ